MLKFIKYLLNSKQVELKWNNCRKVFKRKEFISTGGGQYQDMRFPRLWHFQRHLYFLGYCFLTIRGIITENKYGEK
jgi:hypothetical protein